MNFWPEPTGFAPMATGLADGLAARGWEVNVVTAFPFAPEWSVYPGYRGRLWQEERRGNVTVKRVRAYVPTTLAGRKPSALKRVMFDTSILAGLLKTPGFRPDVIIAICPPLQSGIAAWILKTFWAVPVFYWIQDIVPDAAVSAGLMQRGLALRVGKALERWVYGKVDRLGVISEGFRHNLQVKGVPSERIDTIPNWVDLSRFDGLVDRVRTRQLFGISETDFLIVHAGSVSSKQVLESALVSMSLLANHIDIKLIIIGGGNRLDAAKAEADRLGLKRVSFHPTDSSPKFYALLQSADVLLLHQARAMIDAVAPSKLLTYCAAGKPVVAAVHADSEAAKFVTSAQCGLVVEPEDPQALAVALLELRSSLTRRDRLGANGKAYVAREFDQNIVLDKFAEVLKKLGTLAKTGGNQL